MHVTFEDLWEGTDRVPSPAALAEVLPSIESATPTERQVGVRHPTDEEMSSIGNAPASLDGLASKPWVESVVLGSNAVATTQLPGVRSLFALPPYGCDETTLSNLSGLEQLVIDDALPEYLAHLPRLRDLIFDWSTFDIPEGVSHLRLLDHPEEREPYRRPTAGPEALRGLKGLERLRISKFHYRDRADPIAELTSLRWLSLHGWRNLRVLGRLTRLERLELYETEITSLRALRGLDRLHEFRLMGNVGSLDGIQGMSALEDVWLRGRVGRDLTPLADLPRLRTLELVYPDAISDFSPIGRLRDLRRFELLLGDNTDTGKLPFLHGLDQLEEVILLNVDIEDRRLDPLFDLPSLRRLHLTGNAGPNIDELRHRRPEVEIMTHLTGEPEGRVYLGPIHVDPPAPGIERWSIFQHLADLLGTATNHDAEKRVRAELRRRDAGLLKRLEFDSEAGGVGIYAATEADIVSVAEAVRDLADQK
jgi:hypothetical protein